MTLRRDQGPCMCREVSEDRGAGLRREAIFQSPHGCPSTSFDPRAEEAAGGRRDPHRLGARAGRNDHRTRPQPADPPPLSPHASATRWMPSNPSNRTRGGSAISEDRGDPRHVARVGDHAADAPLPAVEPSSCLCGKVPIVCRDAHLLATARVRPQRIKRTGPATLLRRRYRRQSPCTP
jgi:hypothetical protein